MPKTAMNLKGRTYGRLKVLKRVPAPAHITKRHKSAYWLCRCSCGNEIIVTADNIRQKHTRSCGCLLEEITENRVIDMVGVKVGNLTVLERIPRPDHKSEGGIYWLCQCDCGKQVIHWGNNLRRQDPVKSCGCLSTAVPYTDPFAAKMSSALNVYKRYSDGDLSFEDFLGLTQQPCFYCGKEPKQVHNRFKLSSHAAAFSIEHGDFTYQGIDRVNSKLPHNKNNCVPCCMKCNYTKNSDSLQEFYEHINRIHDNSAGFNKIPNFNFPIGDNDV